MKLKQFCLMALGLGLVIGCHKDSPGQKIVDGLPVSTIPLDVPPAQALQQYLLLNNALMNITITNLNRLYSSLPAAGLSGPDGAKNYTWHTSEKHYGSGTFTIQFQDLNNGALDPFTTLLATSSIKFVHITGNSTSNTFTSSCNLLLSLDTVALLTGPYHMTGTNQFDDSSYSIVYTLDPNGVVATITGFLNGRSSGASTLSSPKTTSAALTYAQFNDVSGTLKWEDQSGSIHVSSNGSGYLNTNDSRTFFQ